MAGEKPISGYTQLTEFITGLRILVQRTGVTTLNHIELDTVLNGLIRYESDVVNNVTTTAPGLVLDARQGKALKDLIDAITSDLSDLAGDGHTDETVKANADAISALLSSRGVADGIATLAGDGKVPSSQLPSYVDDVIEVADYATLPATGETGKIYVTLETSKTYRWSGSAYVELTDDNALWGQIAGTLANQADLVAALAPKADKDTDAVEGNLASFDADGNPIDSGVAPSDKEDADETILKQADIVDALDSTSTTAPLSANQGKVLKDAQDSIDGRVTVLEADVATEGSVLKDIKDNAENATFTDTSGLDSTTLADAINEIYAEKAVANGLASLDATGKVPASQLPVTAMEYKGAWNASTGSYPATPDTGDFWVVSVAGTVGAEDYDVAMLLSTTAHRGTKLTK